jgi:hypothetical protein
MNSVRRITVGEVLGDVQRQRRLAHRRPCRQEDELSRPEAAELVVERPEAGQLAGDRLARLVGVANLRQHFV